MNSKISILAAVLVVQLIIVGTLWLGGSEGSRENEKWLQVDTEAIDSIVVGDGDVELNLIKAAGLWQVGSVPADENKVLGLLDKLAGLDAPWPVATSQSSAARFEVTHEDHQRRIQLKTGTDLQMDLLLGTSPSFQRVHARRAGEDEVFSIGLSNHEIPVDEDEWLDKALLATPGTLRSVVVTFFADQEVHLLEHSAEGWLHNGAPANQDEANTYVNRFKTLRVLGLAESVPDNQIELIATIELSWEDGTRTLHLDRQADDYLLREASTSFKLAPYVAEQLLLTDRDLVLQSSDDGQSNDQPASEQEPSELHTADPA